MSLPQELLSTLNNKGFCHDSLQEMVRQCSAALRAVSDEQVVNYVMVYLIQDACFRVANYLDATQPVTTDRHSQVEALFRGPLVAAIATLGGSGGCEQDLAKACAMLRATGMAVSLKGD